MPSPRRKFRTKINAPAAGTFSANHKSAKKKLHPFGWSLCWRYLFSQPVARQLSSAQMSLTSVFGMGTGGPSSQSTPTIFRLRCSFPLLGELLYYTALSSFVKCYFLLYLLSSLRGSLEENHEKRLEQGFYNSKELVTRTGFEPMLMA